MELISYEIPRVHSDHRPIVLAPLGDLQYSGERGPTADDELKRHIDRCLELNAYFVGLGDMTDFASPSNRQRLKAAALYDSAEDVIEDKALALTLEVYERFLKPTVGRWIGMVHGHHWYQLASGETTDQRLCQMLKCRFLGTSAFIRLQWKLDSMRANTVIWVHHGCGGGLKAHAPVLKLENLVPYWDADIFLIGHMSKLATAPINRIVPRWHGRNAPDLVHKKIFLVGCGGFSKSYVEGHKQGNVPQGNYVEQKMLNPAALGIARAPTLPNC